MTKKSTIIIRLSLCLIILAFPFTVRAQDVSYQWQNVVMGGGGFMTGYLFHPAEEGLQYSRGDVGGVWRYDTKKERWNSLCNVFGVEKSNYYGCAGFAIDPQNPDVIYMAAGKSQWYNCDVLKSTDRGETWSETELSMRFNSNGDSYKGSGECIAVDPINSNIIYVGTYESGMYKSNDGTETWEHDTGIVTEDGTEPRVIAVIFDPSLRNEDKTLRIYAAVLNHGLYVTEDGGESWSLMDGSPAEIWRMDVANDGTVYAAAANGLFRYRHGEWADCSYKQNGAKYRGVAVDPQNSDFVVTVYYDGNNIMRLPVIYSTDGGASWVSAIKQMNQVQSTLYLEENSFSSNTSFLEMDPFNSKHIVIGDWFGIWETYDITGGDDAPVVTWKDKNLGIEQMCTMKAVTHPDNPYIALITAADNDGFPITDLDNLQTRKFSEVTGKYGGKRFMASADIDICEGNANYVVRVGVNSSLKGVSSYSLDGGNTWNAFPVEPLEVGTVFDKQWSQVRVSSNLNPDTGYPNSIVVIKSGSAPIVSHDGGASWTEMETLPRWSMDYLTSFEYLDKDYVLPDTFYCFGQNGYLYRSTDGGDTWVRRNYLRAYSRCELKAAPDMAGEVWLLNGGDDDYNNGVLYRSSDGLKTLTELSNISDVITFGFGKEAPGRENPAVYAYGTVNGHRGIYRSVDMGESWERIDDENIPIGNAPHGIYGSRKEFGTVFVVTGGSGAFYGKNDSTDSDLIPFEPETQIPANTLDVSVNGQNVNISGTVQSDENGEQVTLLIFNPGYDSDDWGDENAVQYQAEIEIGEQGEFSADIPLNFELVQKNESYQTYCFTLYAYSPSFQQLERCTFYAGEQAFDEALVYRGCAYYTEKTDDSTPTEILTEKTPLPQSENLTIHIPYLYCGELSKTVQVFCAFYDNETNELLRVQYENINTNNSDEWQEYTTEITSGNNESIKCFVWNADMSPAINTFYKNF